MMYVINRITGVKKWGLLISKGILYIFVFFRIGRNYKRLQVQWLLLALLLQVCMCVGK